MLQQRTVIQGYGNTVPTCPSCPISQRASKKLVYLFWDKDFIALAEKSIQIMKYIFFLCLKENICWGFSLEEPHSSKKKKKNNKQKHVVGTIYIFFEK